MFVMELSLRYLFLTDSFGNNSTIGMENVNGVIGESPAIERFDGDADHTTNESHWRRPDEWD